MIPAARREEGWSEIERARGSEMARHAGPRGNVAQRAATSARRALTDARRSTDTHGRAENGGPEKERIPFCRAGEDGRDEERERKRKRDVNKRGEGGAERTNVWSERKRRLWKRRQRERERERWHAGYEVFRPISRDFRKAFDAFGIYIYLRVSIA